MKRVAFSISSLILAIFLIGNSAADLKSYVEKPDGSYSWEISDSRDTDTATIDMVRLTSQTWQEIPWQHWLMVFRPKEVTHPEWSMLVIYGGDNGGPAPSTEGKLAQIVSMVAAQTKSVVAVLFQVPNQPLMDGRNEDQLIAYTYDKYLKGEGDNWPLLFPMVKSAVRGMDTIEALAAEKYKQEITSFLLTGGSKRGWTSWLSAATGDPRIKAIAPMVIDVLNMKPQMAQQMATYGGYSNQVEDYTKLKIQERMESPEGRKLLSMVDPWAYRDNLTLPKLVILGANDPYWTVDAANLYFPGLKGEKHLCYQANTGHDVSINGIATLTEFYNAQMTGNEFPVVNWDLNENNAMSVHWNAGGGEALLWQAFSPNRDFREAEWKSRPLKGEKDVSIRVNAPETGWTAYYIEVQFPGSFGMSYGSCTRMVVLPESFPESGRAYDSE